jgi:hypothetical protein
MIMKTILTIVLMMSFFVGDTYAQDEEKTLWKAGTARVVITPEKPIWMAGYSARDKPSDGMLHDPLGAGMHVMFYPQVCEWTYSVLIKAVVESNTLTKVYADSIIDGR